MDSYQKVCEGIYRIRGSRSNIYLVTDPVPVLIDTGMPGDEMVILQALNELGVHARNLRMILITHAHLDHVGALAAVKGATDARVLASMHEKDHIEGRRLLCSMPREGLGGKLFKCMLYMMERFFKKYEPVQLYSAYSDAEGIGRIDGIQIIATPGHSPGSLSFYFPAKKAVFTGDALTGTPKPGLPLRAGCSDYARSLRSAQSLARLGAEICLFGHGEPLIGNATSALQELAGRAASLPEGKGLDKVLDLGPCSPMRDKNARKSSENN
jgi:glyoxylase-like metal-dependent hydrolase (beta-lactamase superfamily II)